MPISADQCQLRANPRRQFMTNTLLTTKCEAFKWAGSLIPGLPFIIRVSVNSSNQWQKQQEIETAVNIPPAPGIYLVYRLDKDTPVYIGGASNLHRRLAFHFTDSASSNNASTLKQYLRKDRLWDGKTPISRCFRFRFFEVPFGRNEIEQFLHMEYKVNTGKC